jgi:glycerol uptake facilitator-like aquaporin
MLSSRLKAAAFKTGLQMFGRLAKVLHQLWHEVIGTFFLLLGVAAIPSTIREWRVSDTRLRAIFATIFIALMLYYGVTSFLRAKRVSRRNS